MWFALVVALLAPDTGQMVVECPQYGRTVAVDRRPVGQTPLPPVTLPTGFHWVEILDGNEPLWSRLVYLSPGTTLTLTVSLPENGRASRRSVRRNDEAPTVAATYDLQGKAGVVGAALGAERQLGLAQSWRLDVRDLASGPLDARIDATVYTPLDDTEVPLLRPRYGWPDRPTVLTTAALSHTRPGRVLRIGRLQPDDPAGIPYVVDGVMADTSPRSWLRLQSTFGRRALEPGLEYISHLVTGLRIDTIGYGGRLSAFALYHDAAYLGLEGTLDVGPVAFSSLIHRVGPHFARIQSRARWRHGSGSLWFEGAFRRRTDGGFERPLLFEDPLSPPSIREIRAHMGGEWRVAAFDLDAQFMLRKGRPMGAERSPNIMSTQLHARFRALPWRPGIRLTWREHEESPRDGPALEGVLRGRLTAQNSACRLSAGLIEVTIDGHTSRTPEGTARCTLALSSLLHAFGRVSSQVVHPQIQARGGPLFSWMVGLELR